MSEQHAMVTCPDCGGKGCYAIVHVSGWRDGSAFGEWRRQPKCALCHGSGKVREHQRQAYEDGQRMREDRKARKLTLREEASRLGITPAELSRREWGRTEPDKPIQWIGVNLTTGETMEGHT